MFDLRDRSGLIQLYFEEETIGEEGFKKAGSLRAEFVIAVTGTVEKRSGAVNENLATGDIEVKVEVFVFYLNQKLRLSQLMRILQ